MVYMLGCPNKDCDSERAEMENTENQIRCECGKLHLVKTDTGYEIKCSRCKRLFILSFERLMEDYQNREEAKHG